MCQCRLLPPLLHPMCQHTQQHRQQQQQHPDLLHPTHTPACPARQSCDPSLCHLQSHSRWWWHRNCCCCRCSLRPPSAAAPVLLPLPAQLPGQLTAGWPGPWSHITHNSKSVIFLGVGAKVSVFWEWVWLSSSVPYTHTHPQQNQLASLFPSPPLPLPTVTHPHPTVILTQRPACRPSSPATGCPFSW